MSAHVDKTQDNKRQSVANEVSQTLSGDAATTQFEDIRPESIQLSKLQGMANNSPQANTTTQWQAIANNSPQTKRITQLQRTVENSTPQPPLIQKKAMPEPSQTGNNTGLPNNLKSGIENLSGLSLDDVKVHRNSDKPAQLQAHAYAQGTDIHLGPGQEKHLPHETWHVVQQKQGRVKPTLQLKGKTSINDDAALEKEADAMGAKALVAQRKNDETLDRAKTNGHLENSRPQQPISSKVTQLRAGNVPTANAMTDRARKAWFPSIKSETATYETIVSAVKLYYDAGLNNYGLQLYYLREMQRYLNVWINKYGALNMVVPIGKQSTTDQRRLVLRDLRLGMGLEIPQVQFQGFVKAKSEHAGNTVTIVSHIRQAERSEDRRLKNTANWILNGGTTKFYAVTPTGDSTARLDANNRNINGDMAFFPKGRAGSAGDILSGSALYNPNDYMDQTNVMLKPGGKSVNGWNEPGAVAIKDGATKSPADIWSLMRHEVQHDLDMNKGRDTLAAAQPHATSFDANLGNLTVVNGQVQGVTGGPLAEAYYAGFDSEKSLQRYKTEYRAYSYEKVNPDSEYNKLNNAIKDIGHDDELFTARQLAIFKHIYANYAYTKTGWDTNPVLSDGRTFRRSIADYFNPDTEGFNKYNSKVVHEFYITLDAVGVKDPATYLEIVHGIDIAPVSAGGKVDDKDDPQVVALKKMIHDMEQIDVQYIFEQCPPMLDKIDKHFEGEAKDEVLSELEFYSS